MQDINYQLYSGPQSTSLPVISHIDSSSISQEIWDATVILQDGSLKQIGAGETDKLASHGITFVIDGKKAWLRVDSSDLAYSNGRIELSIKDTIMDEPEWYNTTNVVIYFSMPPCQIEKEYLASFESSPVHVLEATQQIGSASVDLSVLQQKANEIFQIDSAANCGPIDFDFVKDDQVPLSFDSSTGKLSLNPMITSLPS